VREHALQDIRTLIDQLHRNIHNPSTGLSIAHTVAGMIASAQDPSLYLETATLLIETAATNPDFVAVLPRLCNCPVFGEAILRSKGFMAWPSQVPGDADLRTLNISMRNLLVKYSAEPSSLLLPQAAIVAGVNYPALGLRCAVLRHLELLAPHCQAEILAIPHLADRLFDSLQVSTADEIHARHRAQAALGLLRRDGSAKDPRFAPQALPPEVALL
jgi:hypothetical protein